MSEERRISHRVADRRKERNPGDMDFLEVSARVLVPVLVALNS